MIKKTVVVSVLLGASIAAAEPRQAFMEVGGVWQRSPDGCGTHQVPGDAVSFAPTPHAVGLRTVYLNKNGAVFKGGAQTDAATNTTRLLGGNAGSMVTIKPLDMNRFNWNTIRECVRGHFSKFQVRIVETEPTAGTYIEAIVGGDGTELGFAPGELFGIASADNFCNVTERGIAFNFSETHRNVPRRDEELCATIAHEIGHLMALEHEQLPIDLMSYVLIVDSQTKAFVNQASGCGTTPQSPQSCSCSGANTNSAARLQQFIGLRDSETVPPTLDVSSPGGTKLPPTFDIVATASDNALMSDVVALVDDAEVGSDIEPEGTTYKMTARNVPEGQHTLTIRATDAAGNVTKKDIAITVAKLATGEDCVSNEVCAGGLCAQTADDGNYCTQNCDLANDSCPSDFACAEVSPGTTVCVPDGSAGCCSTSRRSPGGAVALAFAVIGMMLLRGRRRRR